MNYLDTKDIEASGFPDLCVSFHNETHPSYKISTRLTFLRPVGRERFPTRSMLHSKLQYVKFISDAKDIGAFFDKFW